MRRIDTHRLRLALTLMAVVSVLPPVGSWLMQTMLTQMLVQIPLVFFAAAGWGARQPAWIGTGWLRWNAQGAPGLLSATFCLAYWMTPIALDHAAADSLWEAAKVVSLVAVGWFSGISWQLASTVARIFYLGNMVWMSITAGMLYQEFPQRLCNAYLWDDQSLTGEALVGASIVFVIGWMIRHAALTARLP